MMHTSLIAPAGVLLQQHAARRPDKLAFEDFSGAAVTYRQLESLSANLAGHLQDLGLQIGDPVAILLPNSTEWVLACIATLRAGAISVPISHDATEAEIRYRLEDANCRLIIASSRHLALIERLQAELPRLANVIVAGALVPSNNISLVRLSRTEARYEPRDPDDITATSFVIYTSGTTGKAKGVKLSLHGMLWVTAACWAPMAGLHEGDSVLSPLPLFHSYALNLCVLSVLATGASALLLEKFSTTEVAQRLKSRKYTLMPGVPTMYHYLLEDARSSGAAQIGGVRHLISAGAILPASLNRDFEAHFNVPLLDGYGITETSTMVTMNAPGSSRVPGSCGLPLAGLATRIIDAQGCDVAQGTEGQLIVRGPNLMQGYLNRPAETAEALAGGWYHTGDLARSDVNGFLTITGRLKELIIRGGQNIAPTEIEEAILSHPDVLDCAALGIAHPQLGEVPIACIVVREGRTVDPQAIRELCATLLSTYKVPRSVHLVDSIPRTGSGKIMRFRLRELVEVTPPNHA